MSKKSHSSNRGMNVGLFCLHIFSFSLMVVIMQNASQLETINDELAFYELYHSNPWNQAIHFIFVPTIVWTLSIWFVHAELLPISISLPFTPRHRINHGTIWLFLAAYFYLSIDPLAGTLYLPCMYFFFYGSAVWLRKKDQHLCKSKSWSGTGNLLKWSAFLHVASWALQIFGHVYFESGRPALLDSLGQALTIAPLFAFYEGLWALGINKELQQLTLTNVANLTKSFCQPGSPMYVCQNIVSET